MEQEALFAGILEQIKKTAKMQGNYIRKEQVEEALLELSLKKEQMEMVYDYLEKQHIGIDKPPALEDYSTDEFLTDNEKSYLDNYLNELKMLPDYTDGQKRAFTISAMAGDEDAQKKLAEAYLNEVVDIARLYSGQGVFLEDLIGEGNLALFFGTGMLKSLESPDEAEGMLVKLIMNSMEDFIKENFDSAKVSKKALDRVNLVLEKAKALSEGYGRKITIWELADETNLSINAIKDALRISGYNIEYISN